MSETPSTETADGGYTVFLLLTAMPAWLALPRSERRWLVDTDVGPALQRHEPTTTVAWFDAEAFNARPSDVAVVSTTDLADWYELAEELRDTPLWSVPYFHVDDIIVTRRDGFRSYDAHIDRTS